MLTELGRGGFATVYRAADRALGREVALKVLDPLLMRDATFIARFQREVRAAAGREHPQIVPICDAGEAKGRLILRCAIAKNPDARYAKPEEFSRALMPLAGRPSLANLLYEWGRIAIIEQRITPPLDNCSITEQRR